MIHIMDTENVDNVPNQDKPVGAELNQSKDLALPPVAFRYFARLLVVSTVALIFLGALVTTKGAGLAVPDWPLSFGTLFPAMVGGVLFEHGHRLWASGVGFLTLVAAIWSGVAGYEKVSRRVSWLALALVITQGLLGGLTVLLQLPRPVSIAHACLAQLFFCSTVGLWWATSASFRNAGKMLEGEQAYALRVSAAVAFLAVFFQLLLGATMRHMGAGLVISDFPTSLGYWIPPFTSPHIVVNYSHRVWALVVFVLLWNLVRQLWSVRKNLPTALRSLAPALGALVTAQVALGAFTVWSGRGTLPTCLHVTNGALVLAVVFSINCWVYKTTATAKATNALTATTALSLFQLSRKDIMELCKVKLVSMAAFTAVASYWLACHEIRVAELFWVTIGTLLMGTGGAVLNQLLEIEIDRKMQRTQNRPLPAGRVTPAQAELLGGLTSLGGVLILGLIQPLSGLLAGLAIVTYVLVYTPMKRFSSYCTVVGAIPGALPVLVGWTAACGHLTLGGWILFAILFLWQIPHFVAIAWLCQEDYQKAELPMVTVIDPSGRKACQQALGYCLVLLPFSLAPTFCGMAGWTYFFIAAALGLMYLGYSVKLTLDRTRQRARQLLLASVAYLPLLYGALLCIG
jgi:protoheme IX farnesyltransferase